VKVLVVEPQCRGFEHAQFNAALLASCAAAGHGVVDFWGDREHLRSVRGLLARKGLGDVSPETPIEAPVTGNLRRRMQEESALLDGALACARRHGPDTVLLLASISSTGLLALERRPASGARPGRTVAIPHSVLAGIDKLEKRFWNWPLSIRAALRGPSAGDVVLVALSRTILDAASRYAPRQRWAYLPHPYLFEETAPVQDPPRRPIRIGLFGALRFRLREYAAVVEAVMRSSCGVRFELIGHLQGRGRYEDVLASHVEGVRRRPLSYDEYDRRARSVDYAMILADASQHRFTASASLLDAFNFAIPGIYLRTPLVDEYCASVGDIGHVLDSVEEVVHTVLTLDRRQDEARYAAQRRAILAGRRQFTPTALVPSLNQVLQ
jgi:hypothetical protein